jgi:outer membrane autotransporter protein
LKTKLMAGASALTLVMIAPGVSLAAPYGECGVPNTSANPNVASCISDSTQFQDGIKYDQSTYGTPANLKVDLYGTVVVNATTGTTGVNVNGSTDHDALIGARNGAKITAIQLGLQTQATGTGSAGIENHGTVAAGFVGAQALASGTGTASIVNASDGKITVTQSSASIGAAGLAVTGQTGSAVNQGTVRVDAIGATGSTAYGIGGMGLGGGTITLTNANSVIVTNTDGDALGIGTPASAGNLVLANNGSLAVTSGSGKATGLGAVGNGTAGTTEVTNTGALSVTSQNGLAVGMSAADRSDVALAATRTSAASAFTVSGVDATGFQVTGATGAVSVVGTGQTVQVTGSNSATGVSVAGGTTQSVAFTPATVGGTAYAGDVNVNAGGQALGVALSGATDAVSVDFTGARLSVTSTGAGATGIDVAGGSSVDISVIPGNGSGATFAVSAAGGEAIGIATSGATAAQNVQIGDTFRVTNTAGSATGITLADGTDQTVTLDHGATVTGSAGATGIGLEGGSGLLAVTSNGALIIDGGTGDAFGVTVSDGTSQSVTLTGALQVTGAGAATGASLYGGTDQTVSLASGATVTGGTDATGIRLGGGSGALAVTSNGALTVAGGTGETDGIRVSDGASLALAMDGALTVSGVGATRGIDIQDILGAISIDAADTVQVTSTDDTAVGLQAGGDGDVSVELAKGLNVQGKLGAGGAFVAGSGALSLVSAQDFVVTSESGLAIGGYMLGGTAQVARFDGDVTLSGATAGVGALQVNASGPVSLSVGGDFTGTNLQQGLFQFAGTTQSIDLAGNFSLTSATGDVLGVVQSGAGDSASLTVAGAFDVTAAAGSASGIVLDGASASVSLAQGMTVSAAGSNATGLSANLTGDAQIVLGGALSVTNDAASAGGSATGLALSGSGAQSVASSGPVTVSADGTATGFDLAGSTGAIDLVATGLVTVASASGDALGLSIDGGADQNAVLSGGLTVSGAGTATGVVLANGTGIASLDLPAALSVSSGAADATGISAANGAGLAIDALGDVTVSAATAATGVQSAGFTGAQDVALGNVAAIAGSGSVLGVGLSGNGAITLADAGSIVASGMGGFGVSVEGTGTDGAISVSLADVQTSGDGVTGVNLAQTGTGSSGDIAASLASVVTTGADAAGVTVQAGQSGNVSLTLGKSAAPAQARVALAATVTNGVSTQGANANGVTLTVVDGTGTLTNLGTVSTTGANAAGIAATASGSGSIILDSAAVTTTGAGSDGISVQTGTGAQTLTVQSVIASGNGSRGIAATTGSGVIGLAARTVTASGNAIELTSSSGDISAALVGGKIDSATGAGLAIVTGGSAKVTLASGGTLHGATFGLSSDADGGQDVLLAGTVGAGSNHAVALSGGAATLTNSGTINGYMTFETVSTTLTNSGTWNAFGGDTAFAGNATLVNGGTININPAAAAAATMKITGLTTLRNSGTISLVNGHTGDVLDLGNAAFVGSGNSRVVLEANLGASAVGANAAQSADQLNVGAVSGTTTIAIKDLSGATGAQFNFEGIRLVNAASVATGAFVLEGGAVNKGFVDYQLLTDADGNLDLVGVPSTQAFELVRTGAEVRHYWRRSGDAWSDQMRATAPHDGMALWGQILGGSETNRSRPVYSETVLGTATSFAPNLDVRDSWWGGQFGLDWGRGGDWSVGVTGGYVSQEGKVKSTGDRIKLDGGNLGLYARYRSADGLFAHALAKLDRYSLKYDLGNGASAPNSNGTSYGVEIEAGYHIRTGSVFFEPSASASWSDADLDGFAAAGGVGAKFDHVQSFYGRAGMRAGVETHSGDWALQPYLGVNWEGEMNGRPGATLSSGDQDLYFRDASEGGRARWEAGIQGASQGLSAFAKVEGVTGSGTSGIAGRAGVSIRW